MRHGFVVCCIGQIEANTTCARVKGYVKRLTENAQVKRFLRKRYPGIQEELTDLAGMELL